MPEEIVVPEEDEDFDWSDQFEMAIDLLRRYCWFGVSSGVEGLCIECYRSPQQGHADDCILRKYFKRIGEVLPEGSE